MDATQSRPRTRPLRTARFPRGALVIATLGSLGQLDLAEPAASLASAATTPNRMARWRARLTAPIRRLAVSLMLAGAM